MEWISVCHETFFSGREHETTERLLVESVSHGYHSNGIYIVARIEFQTLGDLLAEFGTAKLADGNSNF